MSFIILSSSDDTEERTVDLTSGAGVRLENGVSIASGAALGQSQSLPGGCALGQSLNLTSGCLLRLSQSVDLPSGVALGATPTINLISGARPRLEQSSSLTSGARPRINQDLALLSGAMLRLNQGGGGGVTGVLVQGNLGSAPNSSNKVICNGPATEQLNLLHDNPDFTDPPDDLSILPGSPAEDAAVTLAEVWDDYLGVLRDSNPDIGAYEIGDVDPPPSPPGGLPENPDLASRTSGVAPLAVFFDSGEDGDDFLENRHDWDFGDPGSGTWDTDGRSKNHDSGPVAGHVFENPGTYVVTLDSQQQVTITVQDPDVVFSGTATRCFSQSGNFAGAPAGAMQITTSSLAVVAGHMAAGRRLLLRRGETWSGGATTIGGSTLSGPGIFGAFGSGTRPVISTTGQVFSPRWTDWRLMDIHVVGPGSGDTRAMRTVGRCVQVLVLRCLAQDVKSGWLFSTSQLPAGSANYDQCAIVDCAVSHLVGGSGGNGSMFAGERAIFMGNDYNDCEDIEHVVRSPWTKGAIFGHCRLGLPAETKHCLKLHAPPWEGTGIGNHDYTERVLVTCNIFEGGLSTWVVAAGPEDNHTDQRVRTLLLEKNWVNAGEEMQTAFMLQCRDALCRNNVVDGTGGDGCTGFAIARRGVEPSPNNIQILHNTVVTFSSHRFQLVTVSGVEGEEDDDLFIDHPAGAGLKYAATTELPSGVGLRTASTVSLSSGCALGRSQSLPSGAGLVNALNLTSGAGLHIDGTTELSIDLASGAGLHVLESIDRTLSLTSGAIIRSVGSTEGAIGLKSGAYLRRLPTDPVSVNRSPSIGSPGLVRGGLRSRHVRPTGSPFNFRKLR